MKKFRLCLDRNWVIILICLCITVFWGCSQEKKPEPAETAKPEPGGYNMEMKLKEDDSIKYHGIYEATGQVKTFRKDPKKNANAPESIREPFELLLYPTKTEGIIEIVMTGEKVENVPLILGEKETLITGRGSPVNKEGTVNMPAVLFFSMPDEPMEPGKRWVNKFSFESGFLAMDSLVRKMETVNGKKCLKIDSSYMYKNERDHGKLNFKGRGSSWYSIEKGLYLRIIRDFDLEARMYLNQDESAEVKQNGRISLEIKEKDMEKDNDLETKNNERNL